MSPVFGGGGSSPSARRRRGGEAVPHGSPTRQHEWVVINQTRRNNFLFLLGCATCKIWVLQLVYNKVRTIVVFNNNNCCVEPRGDTAGAAELRRRLAVAVFMEKIAPRLRTYTFRETARARAGRPCGGSSRHSRLSTRADQRTGAWPLDARCEASATVLPAKKTMMRCHTDF